MLRFLGNIEAKTDAKGRVFIPAVFRKQLQAASEESLVLRKDVFQDCLVLYPESVWFKTQEQLRRRLNRWNARQQAVFRQFVSDAEVVVPDGNGRILIPRRYLQMAGIRDEVRFIGMDNTIEIWAKERAELPFMEAEDFSQALQEAKKESKTMTQETTTYHIPVLLAPAVDGLDIRPDGVYVDVTLGGGGHTREILRRLGPGGRLLGFDQDEDAERNIPDDARFTFVRSNFRYLHNFLRYHGIDRIDGLLADLGVSSHHFDDSQRGFSFRFDGALDMRMNKRAGQTAADVVNTYDEERLANVFYLYGELKNSRKLAAALARARASAPVATIGQFLDIVKPLFGREREKKELARVFQALRIEVNHEMEALREMLQAATEALRPGGRLVVITYHSLEDRLVKNLMKTGNVEGTVVKDFYGNVQTPFRAVNNKVIVPDDDEVARNPRSRSAKLRIAEKREDNNNDN